MAVAEELQVLIKAETRKAVRELKNFEAQSKRTEKSAGDMAKAFAAKAAGALAAAASVRTLVRLGKESVELYGRQIQAEQRLAAAIGSTGGEVSSLLPKYKQIASEIQNLTTVGDESSLELMQLATTMGVNSDQIEDVTKGAIGLSKAFGMGTQQAVRGVALAMEGNFTALERYIPALRTAETETEKMVILQKAMADGFDLARAEADSAYGALQQLGNAVGDSKEEIGRLILEGAEPLIRSLLEIASTQNEATTVMRDYNTLLRDMADDGRLAAMSQDELAQAIITAEAAKTTAVQAANVYLGERAALLAEENHQANDLIATFREQQKLRADEFEQRRRQIELDREAAESARRLAEQQTAAAQRNAQALSDLNAMYMRTRQGQIDFWEGQIRRFKAFTDQGAKTAAAISYMEEQLAGLREEGEKVIDIWGAPDWRDRAAAIRAEVKEQDALNRMMKEYNDILAEEQERLLEIQAVTLAGIQTMTSSFENMFQAMKDGASGWEVMGDLATDTIASILRALGSQYAVQAAGELAKYIASAGMLPQHAVAAGKYAAASGAAYAGAGAVKAFARGGDFMTSGPEVIMVGEKGRERVRIDPQPDSRGSAGGGITINVAGVVNEDLAIEISRQIERANQRGVA